MDNKIKQLEQEILKHKELYYSGNAIITDTEFDKLVEELEELNSDSNVLNSVGIREGKSKHTIWMPSIEKFNKVDDVLNFVNGRNVIISEKLDGSSIALYYQDGVFQKAVTRGDGFAGEDKTELLKDKINDIDYFDGECIIWAELVISKDNFNGLQSAMIKRGLEPVKNIRNAVAGIMNRKDNLDLIDFVDIVAHNLFVANGKNLTMWNKFNFLEVLGFKTANHKLFENMNKNVFDNVCSVYLQDIGMSKYLTDGLVITLNQDEYNLEDKTGHHYRWNCCYKFQSDIKETTIKDIIYQVGRTGKITPVAIVEKTNIAGADIERVTLHNYKMVYDNKLKQGDKILITRANEVIPKFIEKTFNSTYNNFEILESCPCCKGYLRYSETNTDLYCNNVNCNQVVKSKLEHFIKTHKLFSIGSSTIDDMVNNLNVNSFEDLFKLRLNDFMGLDGYADKSANKIISEINSLKVMDSEKFIVSLGIPNIGKNVSKQLMNYYGSLSNMFDNVDNDIVVLGGFDGFGDVIIKSIYDNIDSIKLFYNSFKYYGVDFVSNNSISIANDNNSNISSKLNGAKFILSGSFSVKKSIIESNIIENGGQIASSVNKDLDYLVTNETGTSKYLKAVQLGKKIITEEQFMNMLK